MKSVFSRYHLITLLAAGVLFAACNKKLDVNPADQVSPETIKTGADVQAVMNGTYDQMLDYHVYGEQFLLISDLMGSNGDLKYQGSYAPYTQISNRSQDKTSSIAEGMWDYAYKVINNCNIVISKIDLVDADEQAAVGGNAKFVRALMYYELAVFFGKPYSDGNLTTNLTVPLVLNPVLSTSDAQKSYIARATVQDTYTQIENDLKDAVAGLPKDNGTEANKYAAEAILARVYMAEARYAEAATLANDVIENGGYSLTTSFSAAFNNATNSSEDIFAIQQSAQENSGTVNNGIYAMYSPDGRGEAQTLSTHFSRYDANDERGSFFQNGSSLGGVAGVYTLKWSQPYKVIPIIRLSEMYLTRGEANIRAGSQTGPATPLEDISTVRDRAGADPLTSVTADDFVNERFRELAFEGDQFQTEKRLKMDIGGLPYNDNKLVLPVPFRETQVNTKLEQNPGY
jgi:starch-binding outer membrane protein, SusD/RagB family